MVYFWTRLLCSTRCRCRISPEDSEKNNEPRARPDRRTDAGRGEEETVRSRSSERKTLHCGGGGGGPSEMGDLESGDISKVER